MIGKMPVVMQEFNKSARRFKIELLMQALLDELKNSCLPSILLDRCLHEIPKMIAETETSSAAFDSPGKQT